MYEPFKCSTLRQVRPTMRKCSCAIHAALQASVREIGQIHVYVYVQSSPLKPPPSNSRYVDPHRRRACVSENDVSRAA